MKKYFNFAFAGAIALIGTCSFTACSSEDAAIVENNPTYDPVKNEVTTQFVLNVSSATSGTTRMSAATVQRNSNFRGLQDAKLVALSTGNSSYTAPYTGADVSGFAVNKTFDLGTLYGSSAVTAANNEESSSKRVLQLAMPLKADAMLVYARAFPVAEGGVEENGNVTANISTDPSATSFALNSRLNGLGTRYDQACALAAAILNTILATEVSAADAGDFTHNGYTNAAALEALNWKAIATAYEGGTTLAPLAEILAKAYSSLVNINVKKGEVRAGSGVVIKDLAQSLYNIASTVFGATATTDDEANAQRLAREIRESIGLFFNIDEYGNITEWKSIGNPSESSSIIQNLIAKGVITASNWSEKFGQVKSGDVRDLPTGFGLPIGTAVLFNNDEGTFQYKNPSTSLIYQSKTINAANYIYPAELLYFDNSALRVSDTEKKAADYPDGVTPWDTDGNWSGWTTGAIASTTRSVAVKNNINYGVAMLQTKVALDGTAFADNRNAIVPAEANQSLTVDDVKGFKLTGVLVGGQNHEMGWNYLAKANTADDWDYIIYDSKIAGTGAIPTPAGEENYTLVIDPKGHSFNNMKAFATGFAQAFYINDSTYIYPDNPPLVVAQQLETGNELLCFCSVNFPSRDATGDATRATEASSLWKFKVYLTKTDGTVTETVLDISEPLKAGDLKIIKGELDGDGAVRTHNSTVGVSVTLDWNSGNDYDLPL